VSTAVWHDGLFTALAAHVILVLRAEVFSRRGLGLNCAKDKLVVVVCAASRRVIGPSQLLMDSLLPSRHVLAQFDLEGIHPENVHIRLPSDLTGPSTVYTILLRHPRHRMDTQVEWRGTDLQHHGQQTVGELNYIMEPRPDKGLCIYIHDEEPRAHADVPPRGYQDILKKKALEEDADLVRRSNVTCDDPLSLAELGLGHLMGHMWISAVTIESLPRHPHPTPC
jgi:hypothetical protein